MIFNLPLNVSILPFATALLITALITPLVIRMMKKFGFVDDPKRSNHPGIIHTRPIPRGGGIPLFLGALISAVLFLPFSKVTIAIFFAAFIALIIGIIDDKLNARSKDVSPYLRFLINILSAVIVVGSGINIPFITNPFGGILNLRDIHLTFFTLTFYLSDLAAVIWIIWVMNMLNWSKGVDGQMPGVVTISALVIGLLSMRFPLNNPFTLTEATLSFIIAGASLGFLFFNFYPAKIFPGYGATSLYLLLAVASILSSAKLATAILVMGVPLVDGAFTIIRRLLSGKSPFSSDKLHLHHLLLKLGYSQKQIASFYWVLSLLLGYLALSLNSRSKVFAIIMLFAIVGGGLLFLHLIIRLSYEEESV